MTSESQLGMLRVQALVVARTGPKIIIVVRSRKCREGDSLLPRRVVVRRAGRGVEVIRDLRMVDQVGWRTGSQRRGRAEDVVVTARREEALLHDVSRGDDGGSRRDRPRCKSGGEAAVEQRMRRLLLDFG